MKDSAVNPSKWRVFVDSYFFDRSTRVAPMKKHLEILFLSA